MFRRALYTAMVLAQPVVKGSMGQPVVNPLQGVIELLSRDIEWAAARYGMTPLDRFRLNIEVHGQERRGAAATAIEEYRARLMADEA